MKINLANTHVGVASNISEYAKNARKFLIDNVHRITFDHDEEHRLLNTRDAMMRTAMSDIYQQAETEGKLDAIRLLVFDKVDKIPSWFLISWLDIDSLELRKTDKQSADILNTFLEYRDKILIDATPYYSPKRRAISDTTSFYSRVVRALLCRSYTISKGMWLSPSLIYQLTQFYAIILSSKIGRTYQLTYQEQYVAATALAVFFVNRCSDNEESVNPIMGKMDFLRRNVDTKSIYEYISETYTSVTYGVKAVVDTIVKFCPSRTSNFSEATFYSMNMSLTSNQLMSLIALEYPPYWCHLIISAISGDKSSMYHSIKTLNLKRESVVFHNEIVKTNSFIRSL